MTDIEHPKKRRFFTLTRRIMLLLLLLAAFAVYTNISVKQHSTNQHVSDEVFEVRLHNLENSIPPFQKRLDDLEEKINKLPQAQAKAQPAGATATAVDDTRIAALEKEIAALKAAPHNGGGEGLQNNEETFQAIRLLSAFYRLSDKVVAGKPFATELSAFNDLDPDAGKGEAITTLSPYAEAGIPTFAILLSAFDDSVDQLNTAQSVAPADATLWQKFIFNLKHIIHIRRTDVADGDKSVDATVARAQAHLEHEEIEAAQAEIKSLPEDARSNFSSWLDESQIIMEAPSLIDQIQEQVMQTAFHVETPQAKGQK